MGLQPPSRPGLDRVLWPRPPFSSKYGSVIEITPTPDPIPKDVPCLQLSDHISMFNRHFTKCVGLGSSSHFDALISLCCAPRHGRTSTQNLQRYKPGRPLKPVGPSRDERRYRRASERVQGRRSLKGH